MAMYLQPRGTGTETQGAGQDPRVIPPPISSAHSRVLLHPSDIKGDSAKRKHLVCVQTNAQAQLSKEVLNHKRRSLEKGMGEKKLGFTAQEPFLLGRCEYSW